MSSGIKGFLPVKSLAELISSVFHPVIVSPFIFFLFLIKIYDNNIFKIELVIILFFFILFWPLFWLRIFADQPGLDVSLPKRPMFLGLNLLGIILIEVLYLILHAPLFYQSTIISLIIIGGILTIITRFWKISIHLASLATSLSFITLWFGFVVWPGYLAVPLLFWSRIYLKKHTIPQALCGFAFPVIIILFIGQLFN